MGNKTSKPNLRASSAQINAPQVCPAPVFQQRCANLNLAATIRRNLPAEFGHPWPETKLPIVYSPKYNISFWGIENLHPFDSKKYAHIIKMLEHAGILSEEQLAPAPEASLEYLKDVHTTEYLQELETTPLKVAMPMRLMAGGSILAGALALERGWALNLGGGMHHASYHDGGGWCCYDDISLLLRTLKRASSHGEFKLNRAMIVDVDVHQGNGHERSKLYFKRLAAQGKRTTGNHKEENGSIAPAEASLSADVASAADMPEIFTVDVYNTQIYPLDQEAKAGIDVDVPLYLGTGDKEYLEKFAAALDEAFRQCQPPPQLLVYNAGTDILVGDPLGGLNVSEQGVIQRDEMVFQAALNHGVPVVMMTSGGYSKNSAACIAHSIENLVQKFGFGVGVDQHSES